MSGAFSISTCLRTDVGRVRTNNEDVVAAGLDGALLVLADGMGGHNSGEVAARIGVDTVIATVCKGLVEAQARTRDAASGWLGPTLLLGEAIETAHRRILEQAAADSRHEGMGTTLVVALLAHDRLSFAHVGDSRLYRLRQDELLQLTRDHSLLEEMIALGQISREDAPHRVSRNVVTRALGAELSLAVELGEQNIQHGDLVLLCSDGLTDTVPDERIAAALRTGSADLDTLGDELIRLALDSGGRDNISLALGRVQADGDRRQGWLERLIGRN